MLSWRHLGLRAALLHESRSASVTTTPVIKLLGAATFLLGTTALLVACGLAPARAASDGAFCRPPRVISRLPKNAVLDTVWRNVAPPAQLCRVLNHKNLWAGSYSWFQLDARPGLTLSAPGLLAGSCVEAPATSLVGGP